MKRHQSPFVVAAMRKIEIEAICERILQSTIPSHLSAQAPLDVERFIDCYLANAYGVSLDIVESLPAGKEANTFLSNKTITFTAADWDSLCNGDSRTRFTGCHESFHAVIHSAQLNSIVLSRDVSEYKVFCDPEWQADHAAGAFLMPRPTVTRFCGGLRKRGINEMDLIMEVAQQYKVSRSAASTRLSKLEIIKKEASGMGITGSLF